MNDQQKKRGLNIWILSLILLIFAAGVSLGYYQRPLIDAATGALNQESAVVTSGDFESFWKVWTLMSQKYPGIDEISDQEKIWGATKGLVDSLQDPYSAFFDPRETASFEESISGEFGGVGIDLGEKDGVLTVVAPLANTPAEKAGIQPGDMILKIDDVLTSEISIDEAIDLIRGDIGTSVVLTILSEDGNGPKEITLIRAIIAIPTLEHGVDAESGVYIISLYNFSDKATDLFKNAIGDFEKSNATKLIIDVRGNPGGYFDSAVEIASWFVPKGEVVAIESFGEEQSEILYRSKGYAINKKYDLVILVDQGSASASEIFAGAVREYGLATLVGEVTFGKGSVQEVVPITADTVLKITVAKWLTPHRVSLSDDGGLVPDVLVTLTADDFEYGTDHQLEKAIEIVTNKKTL